MEKINYWRLCDEITVYQAVLLIIGCDPGEYPYVMSWQEHERPEKFSATLAALSNAILGHRLPAIIRKRAEMKGWGELKGYDSVIPKGSPLLESDESPIYAENIEYCAEPDWTLTTILVDDLRLWLEKRGFKTGFFFPLTTNTPDFLDSSHKNYAPKLAAAIRAWQAINSSPDLVKGKTVKQALRMWLLKNVDRFELTKDDGSPNEQGIEEIAKVANWVSSGGAPKTPV